jgi:hypothetical protein
VRGAVRPGSLPPGWPQAAVLLAAVPPEGRLATGGQDQAGEAACRARGRADRGAEGHRRAASWSAGSGRGVLSRNPATISPRWPRPGSTRSCPTRSHGRCSCRSRPTPSAWPATRWLPQAPLGTGGARLSRRRSRREPKALKLKKLSKSRGRIVDMFELRAAVPLVRRGNDVPPEPTPSEQRRTRLQKATPASGKAPFTKPHIRCSRSETVSRP